MKVDVKCRVKSRSKEDERVFSLTRLELKLARGGKGEAAWWKEGRGSGFDWLRADGLRSRTAAEGKYRLGVREARLPRLCLPSGPSGRH